jgi:hypothetical protein
MGKQDAILGIGIGMRYWYVFKKIFLPEVREELDTVCQKCEKNKIQYARRARRIFLTSL